MIILSLQVKCRNLTTFILCPLVALTGFGSYSFPLILITGYDDANRCHNGRSIPDIPVLISTWSSSPISPWGRSNYSSQQLTPLFASGGMRSPKRSGRSLNFQFSGRILPPGGTKISLLELKPVNQCNIKSCKQEEKYFASGSLEILVGDAILIFTLWFLDPWILDMAEAAPYIGHWFRAYAALRRTLYKLGRVLLPAGALSLHKIIPLSYQVVL